MSRAQDDSQSDKKDISTLCVFGVRDSVTEDTLNTIFSPFGKIDLILFVPGARYAHIKYSNVREAEVAMIKIRNQPSYKLRVELAYKDAKMPRRKPLQSPVGADLAEDGSISLRGNCRCCLAQTENACSDCRVFYCSINCMTIHADVHMSFCKKLKPAHEIVGGTSTSSESLRVGLPVMEKSRCQMNPGRSPALGFPTRSLMEKKQNSGQSSKNHQVKQNDQGNFHQRSLEEDVGGYNAQQFRRSENRSSDFREPKKFESNGNSQPGKICSKGDHRKFHHGEGSKPQKWNGAGMDVEQTARFVKVMDGAQLEVNKNANIKFVKTEQDVEWVQLTDFPKNVPLEPRSAPMEDSRGNKKRDRVGGLDRIEGTKELKVLENDRGNKKLTLNIPENSHPKTDSRKTPMPKVEPSNCVPTTAGTSSSKPPNKAQSSRPKPVKSLPLPSVLEDLKVGSKEICLVNAIEDSKALVTLVIDEEDVNSGTMDIFLLECGDSEPTAAGVGCLVAVKIFGNELAANNWARGCIIASNAGKDTVALVDYGSKLLVPIDAVYPLPKDMLAIPRLACVFESSDMSCLKVGAEFEVLVVEEVKGGWLCQLQRKVEEGVTEVVAKCIGTFLPWELQPNDVESSELKAFESGTRVIIVSALGISRLYLNSLNQKYVETYGPIYDQVAIAAADAPAMNKLPPVGDLVAAKFRENDIFYRAKVVSHRGEEVKAKFIDFGNTQVSPLSEIKVLPENFRKVPGAAAYITLSNVPDVTSEEALARVNDAILKATTFVLEHDGNLSNGVTLKNAVTNVEFNAMLREVAEQIPKKASCNRAGRLIGALLVVGYFLAEDLEDEIRNVKLEVGPAVDVLVVYAEEKELCRAGKLYCSPAESDEVNYVRYELTTGIKKAKRMLKKVIEEVYDILEQKITVAVSLKDAESYFIKIPKVDTILL